MTWADVDAWPPFAAGPGVDAGGAPAPPEAIDHMVDQ
jgi:hypothetical protein